MTRSLLVLSLAALALACGDDDGAVPDAGPGIDAAMIDFGVEEDAFVPMADAGPADAFVIPPDELVLEPMDPPLTVAEGTIFGTLEYGPGSQQVMDVFVHPDAEAPTPVVLFIHGGGFTGGSRTAAYDGSRATQLQTFLDAGVAYVTIDYSLLEPGSETVGAIKCLHDSRRALQFVRYFAEALNIDPERVGLMGSSAGAGTSLWIGFHDEMADPASVEPIARESTRVQVVAVNATQSTYELLRWPGDVFSPTYPLTVEDLLGQPSLAAQVVTFYGLPISWTTMPDRIQTELTTPAYEEYRAELDMLAWMSADDPPFYARNQAEDLGPTESGFDILHHPLHAATLAERASEVTLEAVVEAPALDLGGDEDATQFVLDRLLDL